MDARAARGRNCGPTDVIIRFSHCDPAGIVYFPRAFDILNGVVEDWFGEGLGLDYHDIVGRRRIGLGYAHAECDFAKPAQWATCSTYSRRRRAGRQQVVAARGQRPPGRGRDA